MRPKILGFLASGLCLLAAVACQGASPSSATPEPYEGPPLPELTPFTSAQAEQFHAIRDDISALRGLPPVDTIREGSISREQWQDYNGGDLDALSDEDRADLDFYNEIWRLMRLIGPNDDLFAASDQTSDSTVVGFYNFIDDALVLIDGASGEEFSLDDESTIAHEYVHSFQDGRFDLEAFGENSAPEDNEISELGTTADCVTEGDASTASELYMKAEHGDDWQEGAYTLSEEEIARLTEALANVPRVILEYSGFNYDECARFVQAVQEQRGWAAVDAMYTDPPTTTEQVMHPQKYLDHEVAVALPDTDLTKTLGEGWHRGEIGAYGEFDVYAYFVSSGVSPGDAARAADGWAGGRSALYRRGDAGEAEQGALVHITLRWDTKADFDDFGVALWYTLGWQGWDVSDGGDHWYWYDGQDAGYALRDEESLQYDLIFANDATAAGIAKAALLGGLAVVPQTQ